MKKLMLLLMLLTPIAAHAADLCAPPTGQQSYWCEGQFQITSAAVIQSANVNPASFRHYIQIQNNSDLNSSTANCYVCFGAKAYNRTCSTTNAGMVLRPGQVAYRSAAGLYGDQQLNSLYFNADISAVSDSGTCYLGVSIDG